MNKDSHLIFENYVDGVTRRQGELAGNIMDIVKYGIPSKEEFIKIRQQLHDLVNMVKKRGDRATNEEQDLFNELYGKMRAYRSQHPDDPPPSRDLTKKEDGEDYVDQRKEKFDRAMDNIKDREHERDEKLKDSEENEENKPNYKAFNAFIDRLTADVKKNGLSDLEKTPGMTNKQAVDHLQKYKKKEENAESKFTDTKPVTRHLIAELEKMLRYLNQMSTAIHLSRSSEIDQLLSRLRDDADMLISERGSGTSEDANEERDDEEGDLMRHMKEKGIIPKGSRVTLPKHETEEQENIET